MSKKSKTEKPNLITIAYRGEEALETREFVETMLLQFKFKKAGRSFTSEEDGTIIFYKNQTQ